jgi:hypothetical protein
MIVGLTLAVLLLSALVISLLLPALFVSLDIALGGALGCWAVLKLAGRWK